MKDNKFEIGDRVIYDGYEFIIEVKNTKNNTPIPGDEFRLYPLNWSEDYPYPNTWVHEDLIRLDQQYYRNEKINSIL